MRSRDHRAKNSLMAVRKISLNKGRLSSDIDIALSSEGHLCGERR